MTAFCTQRFGGALALAALALQIVFSFGHFHPEGPARFRTASTAVGAPSPDISRQSPSPVSNDADDYCAICASNVLVSTSFVPDVAGLPLPVGYGLVAHAVAINSSGVSDSRRAPFRSRAPPLA